MRSGAGKREDEAVGGDWVESTIQHPLNYFAHGLPFLDDPYFLAGTATPDWLTVSDRAVRLRSKHAAAWVDDPSPQTASFARGLVQHFRDDARFHATRAFAEVSLALTGSARRALEQDQGFRPSFLGHLLAELLLDAALIERSPERLDEYYRSLGGVDFEAIQATVNRMAPRRAERLAEFARGFLAARVLWDYRDDGKLWVRLNQIMRRLGFPPLPESFVEVLPAARTLVAGRSEELLDGIPT